MPAPRFVHLRLHSEYSVSDGIVRLDQAVSRAAADGMPALALTDLANLFGLVKFYGAARAVGVKPIIGADCWLQNPGDRDKPVRMLLLCTSRAGYLRLCDLLSRAWLRNQYRARGGLPRLARRGDRGPDRPFWGGGGRRRSGAGCGQCRGRRAPGARLG